MQICANCVVRFHYVLRDEKGEQLDSSADSDPMTYLHGQGGLLPGLESELEGKSVGESFSVTLAPEAAFGELQSDAEIRVPISHLHGPGQGKAGHKWKPGMQAVVQTKEGNRQVTVIKAGHTMATVDTNHPLAGKTLVFDVTVEEVREASAEELAHGHAHGPGGHHH